MFDKHVYACKKDHADLVFKLYVLLELNNYDELRVYEDDFHREAFDCMQSIQGFYLSMTLLL